MADLERNKAVVQQFLAVVDGGGDLDRLDEMCTQDCVNHAARPGLQNGIDAAKSLLRGVQESQGERHWTEQHFVAEGEFVAVFGVREGYWRAPSFRGLPTPQGHISTQLAHLFRLRDGLIAEHWAVRDDFAMMQQLGVLASP